MILRPGTGWQTITADLALILFLVVAQANREPTQEPAELPAATAPVAYAPASPLAIYRPESALPLGDWLKTVFSDERQAATVIVRYRAGDRTAALERGATMLGEVEAAGLPARLLLETAERAEALVVVDFQG